MKCLELKPKRSLIKTDHRFIAKIPLMPNRYLWERMDLSLGLLASDKRDTLLVITDSEDFIKRYTKYYQERFEVAEHGDDYSVGADFETIFGKVSFDQEVEVENDDDENYENEESEMDDDSDID
tara:strand:- start:433 stop:804 length:372 start_codon:yes stop_codon:yes gene_type:complete